MKLVHVTVRTHNKKQAKLESSVLAGQNDEEKDADVECNQPLNPRLRPINLEAKSPKRHRISMRPRGKVARSPD